MAWVAETANPQAWEQTCFSNIVKESGLPVVYVGGYDIAKFYRYNLSTKVFTALADPPASLYGQLAVSPDGTKVVGHGLNGTVLYVYDISANSWTTSAGSGWQIQSMVWADNDTIWCHLRAIPNIMFAKYTVSTDSWFWPANFVAVAVTNSQCMCISTDGARLYAGQCGATYHNSIRYIIATDTYEDGPDIWFAYYFVFCADRHKLWFGPSRALPVAHRTITRWVNPDTEVLEADVFPEYDPATKPTNQPAGIYGKTICIAGFMLAPPENLSITFLPAVTTNPATSIEKRAATLNGTLDDDGGVACDCGFEWGETILYGNTTPTESKISGETFSQTISGLTPNTLYHFRAFATNGGTTYGADGTFTTLKAGMAGLNPALIEVLAGV